MAQQFALYVRDGELDRDLLSVGSKPVAFKDLPSLLDGKYIYPKEDSDIGGILHALFSDQSSLTYINDDLQDDNAAMLLARHDVAYIAFHDYQKPSIDHLIRLGVLENTGARVQLANVEQFLILNALFTTQAASYYRLSLAGQAEVDAMIGKGWATRRSSLLTEAEGKYFNYFLNAQEFSNGPELRNKYIHGSQANTEGEDAHFHTYLIALRMTLALVIKINDDFVLAATNRAAQERPR
ncbi:MAG TPA: hypothetical protein PLZ93_12660 [Nocardioides sp.]|uniref:hypothetical protein n=1 Tax=uncultured Nocardioides sp. TaxID=198441 RepID=UPI0026306343|nr:hypothetical protein [uncultured Nocardioides sp.]HRD60803.1 hypothetical protein [Nocardioides sp.]HRI96463.1 hypothetical protein [Nocardioides sp.]HRK44798.1 hypothetical protein [Nocardioides sp.]